MWAKRGMNPLGKNTGWKDKLLLLCVFITGKGSKYLAGWTPDPQNQITCFKLWLLCNLGAQSLKFQRLK